MQWCKDGNQKDKEIKQQCTSADYFLKLFDITYDSDPTKNAKEHATYSFFTHFLKECEGM